MSDERLPITRIRSFCHAKKVSCETLSLRNVDSKPPQSGYFSGDDDDHREIEADNNAGEWQHVQNETKLGKPIYGPGNLGNPRKEKHVPAIGRRRRALAHFCLTVSVSPRNMSDEGSLGSKRKSFRTFPSAVYRSSGFSGPIILPIGSHSGSLNNVNSKVPVLLKTSSLIPSNAVAGKMSALVIKDPSSPKVTCLGRVRSKQQDHRRTAKPTPVVLHDGKGNERHLACWAMNLMRREKKAGVVTAYDSAQTQQTRRERYGVWGNGLVRDDFLDRSGKKMVKPSSEVLEGKASLASRCISESEIGNWGKAKIVDDKEMNASHQDEQKQQAQEDSPLGASSAGEELCINLSRFSHFQPEINARSSSPVDSSQRLENGAGKVSAGQAPPRNALLLMRNSRVKDVQGVEDDGDDTQAPKQHVLLMMESSKRKGIFMGESMCVLSPGLSIVEQANAPEASKEYTLGKLIGKQLQSACDKPTPSDPVSWMKMTEMWEPFYMASNTDNCRDVFCPGLKQSAMHKEASLSNAELSIWQRRAITKPNALETGRYNGLVQPTGRARINEHLSIQSFN